MAKEKTTSATISDYQQGIICMHPPLDSVSHTTAFVTPVVDHWLDQDEHTLLDR